jgi:hypothetical protein
MSNLGLITATIAFIMYFYTMDKQGVNTNYLVFAYETFSLPDNYTDLLLNGTYSIVNNTIATSSLLNGTFDNGTLSAYVDGSLAVSATFTAGHIINGTFDNVTVNLVSSKFGACLTGTFANGTTIVDQCVNGTLGNGSSFSVDIPNGFYVPSVFGKNLNDRNKALRVGQTGFFASLVMCQIINLFTVRTRCQSFFKHRFRPSLILNALAEVSVVVLLCFLPAHDFLQTSNAEWYQFVLPFCMGLSIFVVDEIKLLVIRSFPNTWVSKLAL